MSKFYYPIRDGGITATKTLMKMIKQTAFLPKLCCNYFIKPTKIYVEDCTMAENNQLIEWHSSAIIRALNKYGFSGSVQTDKGMKYISIDSFDPYSKEAQDYLQDILNYKE